MGSTQPGSTFSLVYATPLLQHQAQFGLNPALTEVMDMGLKSEGVRGKWKAAVLTYVL